MSEKFDEFLENGPSIEGPTESELMEVFERIAREVLEEDDRKEKEQRRRDQAILGYNFHYIGPWRIAIDSIHMTPPEEAVRHLSADMLLFTFPSRGWAGIVLNPDNEAIHWAFDIPRLEEMLKQRGEPWRMADRNTIVCGGHDRPNDRTGITVQEMILIIQRSLNLSGGC